MAVATPSSGRALYDHASAAFVHNMPFEALSKVYNAIQTGQARATPLLAEQFCVLHITALCAIYTPNNPAAALESRLQQWRQQSAGRGGSGGGGGSGEAQWPPALTEQLSLAPPLFFARLWWQTLRFYHAVPTLPSLAAGTSDLDGTAEAIAPTPDMLPAALQLPGAVLEALVLGALKIDEDLARNGPARKAKVSEKDATPPGLQAARAMCEWVLSAYATPAAAVILSDDDDDDDDAAAAAPTAKRRQLYDQYGRVLRLYALEVLGVRLQEWEYGSEMVRCAKLITGDAEEVHARTTLLAELAEAHSQADTRDDRHQAAKDKARRILQEQVEKRKMQASTGDLASSTASLGESKVRSAEQTQSTSPPIHSNGRAVANGAANGKRARPALPERASSSSSANSAGAAAAAAADSAPSRRKASSSAAAAATTSPSGAGNVMPAWSFASIRTALQAWIRQLGGGPAVLLTLIAVALTLRRVLGSVWTRRGAKAAADVASPAASLTGRATSQRQRQKAGPILTAWHKVLATVRMGTQVTYL